MNTFFIVQKKLLLENMSRFKKLPEFEREFKKLSKKYRSLEEDLKNLENVLESYPTGIGKNFTITHYEDSVKIVKTRLVCRSLRDRSMRVIYAYHDKIFEFMYIEIYFKGDKENEDRDRIKQYLWSI